MGDVIVEIDLRAKNEAAAKPAPRPTAGHKLLLFSTIIVNMAKTSSLIL